MLYQNAIYEMPDPETKIWRYMDFTKFVSMIDNNALYFTGIEHLNDSFEGSLTKKNIEDRHKFISLLEKNEFVKKRSIRKEQKEPFHKSIRKNVFVNCWHMNKEESAAMWKLYLKSDEGVAIQSTTKRLESNLYKFYEEIIIGKVKYIDYKTVKIQEDVLSRFMYKRRSFEHEQELRAILLHRNKGQKKGILIPVDFNDLVERVYISPTADEWFSELVKAILKKYQINVQVEQSSLAFTSPLF